MIILTGVRQHCIVVLICFSLVVSDAGHLYTYLLAVCICFLEKCLYSFSAHFKTKLFYFIFLLLSCVSYSYILFINSPSAIWFNFFSFIGCILNLLAVYLAVQKLFLFDDSHMLMILLSLFFMSNPKKHYQYHSLLSLSLFSSNTTCLKALFLSFSLGWIVSDPHQYPFSGPNSISSLQVKSQVKYLKQAIMPLFKCFLW